MENCQTETSVTKLRCENQSLDTWNALVSDCFPGCAIDTQEKLFSGSITHCRNHDVGFDVIRAGQSKARRWQDGYPARRSGYVFLHLHDQGHCAIRQGNRYTSVAPDEVTFCDPDRPHEIEFKTAYRMFVLHIPVQQILPFWSSFDIEAMGGKSLDPAHTGPLISFLRSISTRMTELDNDEEWLACVRRVTRDLALNAITGTNLKRSARVSSDLRRAVLDHILNNLDDPDLRSSTVAAALGISRRSVQAVFEPMHMTSSAFILDRRLERAAQILRRPGSLGSLTTIAYDQGFNDSAYFSRSFKAKYGMPPRQYRVS